MSSLAVIVYVVCEYVCILKHIQAFKQQNIMYVTKVSDPLTQLLFYKKLLVVALAQWKPPSFKEVCNTTSKMKTLSRVVCFVCTEPI